MKKFSIGFWALLLVCLSCSEDLGEKPSKLITRDRMVEILVDIHLTDAAYQTKRYTNETIKKYSESDYYYSILKKHGIADSVFEKSLLYYSGKPKEFEKIYTRVINKLTLLEQEEKKKTEQPVNLETRE